MNVFDKKPNEQIVYPAFMDLKMLQRSLEMLQGKRDCTVLSVWKHSVTGWRGVEGILCLQSLSSVFRSGMIPNLSGFLCFKHFLLTSRNYFALQKLWPCHSSSPKSPRTSPPSLAWMLPATFKTATLFSHDLICPALPSSMCREIAKRIWEKVLVGRFFVNLPVLVRLILNSLSPA